MRRRSFVQLARNVLPCSTCRDLLRSCRARGPATTTSADQPPMASLSQGAESLIASLAKAQAELEWVQNALEAEFARRHKDGREANPYSILTRINKLRRELPVVQDECRQVLSARQAVVDAAKQQLAGNTELLAGLQRRAGLAPDPAAQETLAAFEGAMREHERTTSAPVVAAGAAAEAAIDREQLNEAFVSSALGG